MAIFPESHHPHVGGNPVFVSVYVVLQPVIPIGREHFPFLE